MRSPRCLSFLSGFSVVFAGSAISKLRRLMHLTWDFTGAPSRTPASPSAKADPSLASSVGRNAKNVPLARSCPAGRVSTSSVRVLRPLTNWGLPSCGCQPPTGAPSRIRTCNRRIRSPLATLSLTGKTRLKRCLKGTIHTNSLQNISAVIRSNCSFATR